MTDYQELKRLAEAAKACAHLSYYTSHEGDFQVAASPDVVLKLLAEIEQVKGLLMGALNQRDTLRTQNQALREAVKGFHTWAYGQRKQQSKGGHASFDFMELREQMDIAEAALKQAEGGV